MKVHFIAIGGSAMHNLALALHHKGDMVSGSDDQIFEPSKSRLQKYGLLPKSEGWDADRITDDLDCVILGMHARPDNPELAKAKELNLPIYSYPEFIYNQCKDKTRVVIAGSHGKTTISAMILHVLHYHNLSVDFMIGAQLEGFDTMVKLSDESEFVLLEGDEYLSSPIDKRPKFLHYRPNIALISGIAWDHYNVFPTFKEYKKQFSLLMDAMEAGGAVVYNQLDEEVREVVEENTNTLKKFAYDLPDYEVENGQATLHTDEGPVPLSIFGRHNMNNLEGARWICNQMGVTDEQFYEAISSFTGASRRLETLIDRQGLKVFRDFAHAPSKVKATVEAVAESFTNSKIIAVLELHTFSSLNTEFMAQYSGALDNANSALIYFNPQVVAHKKLKPLSTSIIRDKFQRESLQVFDENKTLRERIKEEVDGNTVVLIMSSGSFDGINWKSEFNGSYRG